MVRDEARSIGRRTVLRTMSATAAAAVGATGTAAADNDGVLEIGDHVEIAAPYPISPDHEACNGVGIPSVIYEPGTTGCLLDYKECFYDADKFLFEPDGPEACGWLVPSYFEETGRICFPKDCYPPDPTE